VTRGSERRAQRLDAEQRDAWETPLVLHEFLSPRQAAERLGVHRETIYRLCARGELPHTRVGSAVRVDLAAYVARFRR